jgi:peptidoglycan hydrolase-like protein with peptidoglycan-binding domain
MKFKIFTTVLISFLLLVLVSSVAFGATLKYGDKGDIVLMYQNILSQKGYFVVKNGVFDKTMRNAVVSYQKDNFLIPDGIIGKRTETSLIYEMFPNVKKEKNYQEEIPEDLLGLIYFEQTSIEISRIKCILKEGKFLSPLHNEDNIYDRETLKAILRFQKANGLKSDGIIGIRTRSKLYNIPLENLKQGGEHAVTIINSSWNMAKYSFELYKEALITDVKTGKTFKVKRTGGVLHADVEPISKKDTDVFRSCLKNLSWTWERRPILIDWGFGNRAASCNANPHGYDSLATNGFNGHFCVHFINSKTHGGNTVDPAHQNAVEEAFISIYGVNFRGFEVNKPLSKKFIPVSRSRTRERTAEIINWYNNRNIFEIESLFS